MRNYLFHIEKIKKQHTFLQSENFDIAPSGTRYKVFISKKYVIRFKDDNHKLLFREVNFLKKLDHHLIPKVLLVNKIDELSFMIENRLPGNTMDLVWKKLPTIKKINIIDQVVEFLYYLKTQERNYIYSVQTGEKYNTFLNYLTDGIKKKDDKINKFKQADKILKQIRLIIEQPETKNIFANSIKTTIVHGDLIIHNLLTDGKNLTGVLDWEFALFGDPEYDLCRLFYYQECAKDYQRQGIDETFEADYMDKLITAILKSGLIKNQESFQKKYNFVRAIFNLNTLYWAANSNNPQKNLAETINQCNKKGLSTLST